MSESLRRKLFRLYWAARSMIAPSLCPAQNLYEEELCRCVSPQTRWLDLGCGHQVLGDWRLEVERELVTRAAHVTGVDPDRDATIKHRTIADIRVGTAEQLPFAEATFDLVTANMVVEHLVDPEKAFREVFRVLAPGGVFLLHTPNVDSYGTAASKWLPTWVNRLAARILEGRSEDDVYVTYYRCNSDPAISKTAAASGFGVSVLRFVATDAVFVSILPIAALELLWIRRTMRENMKSHRANIIASLRKPY